jgi:transposase
MLYIGLDVHSKWMTIKGFDSETSEIIEINKVSNDDESIRLALSPLRGQIKGVMETGTNSWAMYRKLIGYFDELIVVDPASVWGREIRRGAKTDKRDAMKLAVKLSRGELEGLYIPDDSVQDKRILTRSKKQASDHVTKLVNEIGSIIRSWGIDLGSSILTKRGRLKLESLKDGLPDNSVMVLNLWLDLLDNFINAENAIEAEIKKAAEKDEAAKLLMTIPGVGSFTALAVSAEVGDVRRFKSAKHLISYSGLSPNVHQSGDKLHYGKLNGCCNRFLRYVMILRGSGVGCQRGENPFKKTYWRVLIKNHYNDAKVAVARKMLRIMYSMLQNKEKWDIKRHLRFELTST